MSSVETGAQRFEERHGSVESIYNGGIAPPQNPRELYQQRRQALETNWLSETAGMDPLKTLSPVSAEIEMERRVALMQEREKKTNLALQQGGWGEFKQYMEGIAERYRANESGTPVVVDPNELADMRHRIVKMNMAAQQADPEFDIWSDRRTKEWVQWLNREASAQQPGYFTSGQQQLDLGVTGTAAMVGVEAFEGMSDFGLSLIQGTWDLADKAVQALGGDTIGHLVPTNYIKGPNGEMIPNNRVVSPLQGMSMGWAYLTGKNVEDFAAEFGRTRELEVASRNGFQTVVLGASRIAGTAVGFGVPGGAAMRAGQLGGAKSAEGLAKGLRWLGTLGAKGEMSQRALKINQVIGGIGGAAIANGVTEGVAYGHADGYAKSFIHGATIAPILQGLGWLGAKSENIFLRANMPQGMARAISGGMEGLGFGALEAHAPDLLPAAWGFMKNPNESTWETYAKNMLGMAAFKVGAGRSIAPDPFTQQLGRQTARRSAAEQFARGEVAPEKVAAQGVDPEVMRELGQQSARARDQGLSEAERRQARERVRELEEQLDIQEFGQRPQVERELEQIDESGFRSDPLDPRDKGLSEFVRAHARRRLAEAESVPRETRTAEKPDLEAARRRVQEAETPEARQKALAEYRKLETQAEEGRDVRPIGKEGFELEMRPSRQQADVGEWLIRSKEGDVIGHGQFQTRGGRADIWSADVVKEHRGKGLYSEVLKELHQRYPEGVTSPGDRTDAAKRAWERAGLEPTEIRDLESARIHGRKGGSFDIPPTRQIEAEPGVEQVRARDIYAEMQGRPGRGGTRIPFTSIRLGGQKGDPVQVALGTGKLGRKGVEGIFRIHENLMRTKEARDLVVASHEWSHAMHRHLTGQRGEKLGKELVDQFQRLEDAHPGLRNEVMQILKDYPGAEKLSLARQWAEVWAEWNARNLLNEPRLDQKYPATSAAIRSELAKRPDIRQQYDRIQTMLDRYNRQGSRGRVRQSRVSDTAKRTETEKATEPTRLERAKRSFMRTLIDDKIDLKASQEKWLRAAGEDPEMVSIMDDAARSYDALAMTAAKQAEHFLLRGFKGPQGRVEGISKVMKRLKGREEDFVDYLVSIVNAQRYKRGKKTQLPITDYVETIKELQRANPDFRQEARNFKKWTDHLIDFVARSGNLPKEDAERIKSSHAVYVPLFRVMEGPAQHPGGRGVAERGRGFQRVKEGSTLEIRDPLIALQEVAQSMIAKAHQNQVMQALFNMSVKHEAGGIATIVERGKVPHDHPVRVITEALKRRVRKDLPEEHVEPFTDMLDVLAADGMLSDQAITLFSQKVIPTGERNIIAFTPRMKPREIERVAQDKQQAELLESLNGKMQWLEINDPRIYESLMGIDKIPTLPPTLQGFLNIAQVPRDVVRFFATGVAPGFVAANMFRDAMSTPLFTRDGKFRPFGGFVKIVQGGIEYHRNGKWREMYEELGVRTSSFFTEGRRREIAGQHAGWKNKLMDMASTVQDWFSHPENYIRMAEFKQAYEGAIKAGKSKREAQMLALEAGREITVNFARAGVVSRALNQMIPYFNASMQGKRKLWGQLLFGGDAKSDEAKARVQRAAFFNGLANITVPATVLWLMNKDEEWYQDLPDWRKVDYFNFKWDDQIISIPKPFEAGALFASLPEALLDRWYAENGNPAGMKQIANSLAGGYMEGIASLLPAFLKPALETQINYSFFRGTPITPDYIQRSRIPEEQATYYTTEIAKILSRAVNGVLAPTEIENLVGGYTAGAATSAMRTMDEMLGLKDHPALAAAPWSRFTRQTVHGQSDFVDALYEVSREFDQLEGSDRISRQQAALQRRINSAKRRIASIRKNQRAGRYSVEEAQRRSYEIARPLVEKARELQ